MSPDPDLVAKVLATPDPADIPEARCEWRTDEHGPRYGWHWHHADGRVEFLGTTWVGVRDTAAHWVALWRMRAAIGAHEGMDGEGWRATWKCPSAGVPSWKTIAMKLGAEAQPDLIAEHTPPPGRRFMISATKKRTT